MPETRRLSDRLARLQGQQGEPQRTINPPVGRLSERLAAMQSVAAAQERAIAPMDQRLSERLRAMPHTPGEQRPAVAPPSGRLAARLSGLPAAAVQQQAELAPPTSSLFKKLQDAQQGFAQQASEFIRFGEWLPDQAEYGTAGSTEALNVVPVGGSYAPVKSMSVYNTTALEGRVQGAAAASDTGGNNYIYAGTSSKLYAISAISITDVSKVGGYAIDADAQWEFCKFENRLFATNIIDDVQAITIGASIFADLITSTAKPKAAHMDTVRNFLMLGNTSDGTDGSQPWRVWWSEINNPASFSTAATTQCDYEDLAEGGAIQRVIGGAEYALIFQDRAIVRATYVGSPIIFQFDPIDRKRGTPIPGSVIGWGRRVFFITEEGFFFTEGQESVAIGQNKVDNTFWEDFALGNFGRVSAAIDPARKLVLWTFPGAGSSGGIPNVVWAYSWTDNRWSRLNMSAEFISRMFSQGYTLEELDSVSSSIDALPASLDSRQWVGGEVRIGAFGTDHKLYFLTGANLGATITTGEFELVSGRRSRVSLVRPLANTTQINVSVASRPTLGDTVSFGASTTINSTGNATMLSEGRYHRVQVSITASVSWDHAIGVEVIGNAEGTR